MQQNNKTALGGVFTLVRKDAENYRRLKGNIRRNRKKDYTENDRLKQHGKRIGIE